MRLSLVIAALLLLGCLSVMALIQLRRPIPVAPEPVTATALLRAFKCHSAETKQVVLRGIEDGYSLAGTEPNFLRPGRGSIDNKSFFANGSYDQVQANRRFTDSIPVPDNVASGLLVLRMKAIDQNDNDTIAVGDITTFASASPDDDRYSSLVSVLGKETGWTRHGDVYAVSFADLRMRGYTGPRWTAQAPSLLDFVGSGGADGWIDLIVQDDTGIDVAGAAFCIEPPRGKGLSLAKFRGHEVPASNVVVLSCGHGGADQHECNPYVGDTSCKASLPVACIRPMGAPVPKALNKHIAGGTWSGGRLAFTAPIPAERFATIGAADTFCASTFGQGWRVAEHHDGMTYTGIAGYGDTRQLEGRAWIDIVGQPYATCWAR